MGPGLKWPPHKEIYKQEEKSAVMKAKLNLEALYKTMHNCDRNYREKNQGLTLYSLWRDLLDSSASVIEIGCGNGKLCEDLSSQGFTTIGLDVAEGLYERKGYLFVRHDLTSGKLPFNSGEIDYCLAFDVLEHLPPKWINEIVWDIARVAKKGIVLSIACYGRPPLHLTVHSPEWWAETLKNACRDVDWEILKIFNRETIKRVVVFYGKKKG